MKLSVMLLLLIVTFSYAIQATLSNGSLLIKGQKKVLLLGDRHPLPDPFITASDHVEIIKLDMAHSTVLLDWVKKIALSISACMLVEASKHRPETIDVEMLEKAPFIPLGLLFPYMAKIANYHLNKLSFVYADIRTDPMSDCVRFVHDLITSSTQDTISFQAIKHRYLHERRFTITAEEFYNHLENQVKMFVKAEDMQPLLDKLLIELERGKKLLGSLNQTEPLIEALYKETCCAETSVPGINMPCSIWINCFDGLFASVSFINELILALQRVDTCIVIAGSQHIIDLHSFLLDQRFHEQKSFGNFHSLRDLAQNSDYKAVNSLNRASLKSLTSGELLAHFLQDVESFLLAQEVVKSCAICSKESTKYCSTCKKIYYCSAECQKKHWPEHKKVCKK